MPTRHALVCFATALALTAGCTPGGSQSAAEGPASAALEPGLPSVAAPLVLALRGPDPLPAGGTFDLTVDLQASGPLRLPVTLTVALPSGVTLAAGRAVETFADLPAGATRRTFSFTLSGPLAAPIVVTADGRDPGGAMGFHAERMFPEPRQAGVRVPMVPGAGGPPGSRIPAHVPMTQPAK